MMRWKVGALALIASTACTGPQGPAGPAGPGGDAGLNGSGPGGDGGLMGCIGLPPGQTAGLSGTLGVSTPANGQYFVAGEQATLTVKFTNTCGQALRPANLGTASLYVSGPRTGTLVTRTASHLMNATTDGTDRQHFGINLQSPHYADATQNNLGIASDGTITYKLAPVGSEAPGTYTAGIWAVSTDGRDQLLPLVEFQVGTATLESYAVGPANASTCYDCHKSPANGKSYQAHILPGFSPVGNYALDQNPIGSCLLCHNLDSLSRNPIVRKVHGAHRGHNQTDAGIAHPDYAFDGGTGGFAGLGVDDTLAAFSNVTFPSQPGNERDCQKCHTDNRWMTKPSRLACGTCHDNVFFDTGTINPPSLLGRPGGVDCVTNTDCINHFGSGLAQCNVLTGVCQLATHPTQRTDNGCVNCHTSDSSGLSPIALRHQIPQQTLVQHLRLALGALTGADGGTVTSPIFFVGDTPTMTFTLTNGNGTPRDDLVTNNAFSANLLVSGPTTDRQRIVGTPGGAVNMRTTGTLTANGSGQYTYTFATALPANAIAPVNSTGVPPRPNPEGTYTLYVYIVETQNTDAGVQYRDYASIIQDFKFGADLDIRPRQVVSNAACDTCHVDLSAHGSNRRDGTECSHCHSEGAVDRIAGATGASCMSSATCGGNDAGWESCHFPSDGGITGTCVIDIDPTPNASIYAPFLIHDIHFARLRGGFLESNYGFGLAGKTVWIGFNNSVVDVSEVLFPMDIRSCTKCHTDSNAACSTSNPCGIGQTCTAGRCVNTAWMLPSGKACLTCHDEDHQYAHVQIMTFRQEGGLPDGGTLVIESCHACHDINQVFSVQAIHNITSPYVPPYSREPMQ